MGNFVKNLINIDLKKLNFIYLCFLSLANTIFKKSYGIFLKLTVLRKKKLELIFLLIY